MGIILIAAFKEYGKSKVTVFRGDHYKSWKHNKTNNKELIQDILDYLNDDVDICVAHNGEFFDKKFVNTLAIKFGLKPTLRRIKSIDPVLIARRHLLLGRNSLASIIDAFGVKEQKMHVPLSVWQKAALDGDRRSMDILVKRCISDVKALEEVYKKVKPLVDTIDKQGSSR